MSPKERSAAVRIVDLNKQAPDPAAVASLQGSVARRFTVIPLRYEGERLILAMAEPNDDTALDEVAALTGIIVEPALAKRQDILEAIESFYGAADASQKPSPVPAKAKGSARTLSHPDDEAPTAEPEPVDPPAAEATPEPPAPEGDAPPIPEPAAPERAASAKKEETPDMPPESAPSKAKDNKRGASRRVGLDEDTELVDLHELLEHTLVREASDLHLTNGLPPTIRVDGQLIPIEGYPLFDADVLRRLVYGMLSQKQRERFEEELELDFSYALPGKARFRVNVYQQRGILGAAFRLIPFEIKSLEALGVPKQVGNFANLPRGLIVVTGPTGSGKSTTLAALVDVINRERAVHIMTVEDPIEFLHVHKTAVVNQREVGSDTHGFAAALKHVLRQDPDVILVGEMRDLETIQMAITAAETGHLVFGTLHTQDAPQTVDRMIDVFPPHQQQQVRVQLAGSLMGVVAQQLLPLRDQGGRAPACEVMVVTPAIRNLIREGKTHQIYSVLQSGGQFGMQTMDAALAEIVRRGVVPLDVAKERCHNVEEFARLAGSGGGGGMARAVSVG